MWTNPALLVSPAALYRSARLVGDFNILNARNPRENLHVYRKYSTATMVGHQHYDDHFSINNIPFGVGSSVNHPVPQCVTRLERTIIFLGVLQQSGAFSKVSGLPVGIFEKSTLNEYAALSKDIQHEVRKLLQSCLTGDLPPNSTENVEDVTMNMPVSIGGFTDFSCSLHHVKNAGRAILNDDTPPPGFFNFPIGYTGRASTIVVSGTPIVRPQGHFYDRTASTETKPIIFGPSRALDYELELGFVVGKSVPRLQGLNAKDAEEHIFGMVILNDWSGTLATFSRYSLVDAGC